MTKILTQSYFIDMEEFTPDSATLETEFSIGNAVIHNNTDADMFIYFGNSPLTMGDQRHEYTIEKYSFATIPLNQKHKAITIAWSAPSRNFKSVRVDLTEQNRPFFIQKNSPITGEDLPKSAGGMITARFEVASVPITLAVGEIAHPFRKSLMIKNISVAGIIYIGAESATVLTQGFPIGAGEHITFDTNNSNDYYGISTDGTPVEISVMELY